MVGGADIGNLQELTKRPFTGIDHDIHKREECGSYTPFRKGPTEVFGKFRGYGRRCLKRHLVAG